MPRSGVKAKHKESNVRTEIVWSLESSRCRYPLNIRTGEPHEEIVRPVLARFSRRVRAHVDQATELGDAATADVLNDISRRLETQLWIADARLF